MKRRNIKFLILFSALLLILDAAFARYLVWVFPNETAWGAEPHYNFEYRIRNLERNRDPEEFRIIVAGSSISEYSVHEEYLKELLEEKNFKKILPPGKKKIGVYLVTHQGQNSINLLSTSDRILSLRPDLVIHPVNMIEFRLERPLVLGNLKALDGSGESREKALRDFARSVVETDEVRMLGPYGLLSDFSEYLTFQEKTELFMSLIFATYRYRDLVTVPFERYYKNRFGNRHSYHYYSGVNVSGHGVNHNGHVGPKFEVIWNETLSREGLDIQIYPQMFLSGPVYLEVSSGCTDVKKRLELKAGWQKIEPGKIRNGEKVCMEIHPGLYSDFFADTLGGRLADNTGTGPREHSWIRERRREDDLYRNYSKKDYAESFRKRIMRFDRAGMAYLQAIMKSKKEMARRKFDGEYPVFTAYAEWKRRISKNVPLLIVNAPENPINFEWYGRSEWYAGYLSFLSCPESSGCRMYDASTGFPENHFYDFHHMSWYGARKFTELLSDMVKESYPVLEKNIREGRN